MWLQSNEVPGSHPGKERLASLPLILAFVLVVAGGFFLLNRAAEQVRDTTRKHHLQDIEQALYFARSTRGTYPPYDQPSWCGSLSDSETVTHVEIEEVLREQNNQYANPAKPFPLDPLGDQVPADLPAEASAKAGASAKWGGQPYDYFYWKRSPGVFELYATLEQDDNNERSTAYCETTPSRTYDYGLTSRWRERLKQTTS